MPEPEFEPRVGFYPAGKTAKKKLIEIPHPDKVWVLEYFHDKLKKWVYMDKGHGVPFGPWKMESAIFEMSAWAKSTTKTSPKWVTDGVEWRIRNVETGEVIPHSIFGT